MCVCVCFVHGPYGFFLYVTCMMASRFRLDCSAVGSSASRVGRHYTWRRFQSKSLLKTRKIARLHTYPKQIHLRSILFQIPPSSLPPPRSGVGDNQSTSQGEGKNKQTHPVVRTLTGYFTAKFPANAARDSIFSR